MNLLNNALQHNSDGTRVTVAARHLPGGRIELVVSDDGRGLPPELRESPFDSARRHRSTTAGAGLGLSIARGIVIAHYGTIDLVPSAQGASFRIVLPLEAAGGCARACTPGTGADQREPRGRQ